MNASWPDGNFIDRRRLLELAGGAGLAAVLGACAGRTGPEDVSRPMSNMSPSLAATTGLEPSATASPTGDPTAALAPLSNTAPAVLLCREAWGARPARPGGIPQVPGRMTIHHSAVTLGDNRNAPERIRADQRYHQDSQGWIDIAYHIGVDRKGNIYQLRDPGIVGDTATSYDPTGHLLILCEGNFDDEQVTEELLAGVALACAWGVKHFGIPTEMIFGHRDFAETSCPGANLYPPIESGGIRRRVEDLVAAAAGDLQLLCGPAADAKVDAIEAGN